MTIGKHNKPEIYIYELDVYFMDVFCSTNTLEGLGVDVLS